LGAYKRYKPRKKGINNMYEEHYEDFIYYFWIETDWGILWLSFVLTYFILSIQYILKERGENEEK